MKKVLLSLAAVAAIGVAVPAAAQSYGYDNYGGYVRGQNYGHNGGAQLDRREAQLAARINTAFRRGEITRYEAERMTRDLQLINGLELQYRRGGLNGREANGVQRRLADLAYNLERARRGEHPYGGGYARYGYNNRGYGW